MSNTKFLISNKGVSLYLAIIIMVLLLAMALGINAILLGQLKMIRGMGDSVIAFFAADTGIERALYEERSVSGELDNGARYEAQFLAGGGQCDAPNYCLKSIGTFKETKRAIEVAR